MTLTNSVLQFTAAVVAALTGITAPALAQNTPDTRFEIVVPRGVHAEAITGRAYVMIARTASREPRLQVGRTGEPFFGRDVEQLRAG